MSLIKSTLSRVSRHKPKFLTLFSFLGFLTLYLNNIIQASLLVITVKHPLEIRSFIVRAFFTLHALAVTAIHHICYRKRNKSYAVLALAEDASRIYLTSRAILASSSIFLVAFIAMFPSTNEDTYEPELMNVYLPSTVPVFNSTFVLSIVNRVSFLFGTLTYVVNSLNLLLFMTEYNAQIASLKAVRDQIKRFVQRNLPSSIAFADTETVKINLLACMRNVTSFVSDHSTVVALWSIDFYANITLPVVWIAISRNSTVDFTGLVISCVYSFTSFVVFTETSYYAGQVHAEIDDLLGQIVLSSAGNKLTENDAFAAKETFKGCQAMLDSAGINTVNRQFLTSAISSTFNIAIILYQVVPQVEKNKY